jgi:hypothetical protein
MTPAGLTCPSLVVGPVLSECKRNLQGTHEIVVFQDLFDSIAGPRSIGKVQLPEPCVDLVRGNQVQGNFSRCS